MNEGKQPNVAEIATTWDTVIIGAGPAGSVAAIELGKLGYQVLLVDRANLGRNKVCGCCLNPRSLSVFQHIGELDRLKQLDAKPLNRLRWQLQDATASLPLPQGLAVSRIKMDRLLVDAAQSHHVTALHQTTATVTRATPRGCKIQLQHQGETKSIEAQLVIAADGLAGSSLKNLPQFDSKLTHQKASKQRMGIGGHLAQTLLHDDSKLADQFANQNEINMIVHPRGVGYIGLVRLEDDQIDIAAAFDPRYVKSIGGPGQAVIQTLQTANLELPPTCSQAIQWQGTSILTRQRTCVADQSILVAGDAAGYVEPFTGEGMAWAMTSGLLVAQVANHAIKTNWSDQVAASWQRELKQHVRQRRWICQSMAWLLRHPHVARTTIQIINRYPALAKPILRYMGQPVIANNSNRQSTRPIQHNLAKPITTSPTTSVRTSP